MNPKLEKLAQLKKAKKQKIKILALDVASNCGWAISNSIYGVWDLRTRKDESVGMKLIRLRKKLNEIIEAEGITLIVYERPAGRHANSVIHEAKLIAIIEEHCEDNGINYRSFSATEIKSHATGKGNSGKPAMIKAAKDKLGYKGNNDNEADALWLLNLAKQETI